MGFIIKNIKVNNSLTTTIETLIKENFNEVLDEQTKNLQTDLKAAWPVDTGRSRAGWKQQPTLDGYSVTNDITTPDGYDYVGDLWMGSSRQMPDGGDIIYQRWQYELREAINNINLE